MAPDRQQPVDLRRFYRAPEARRVGFWRKARRRAGWALAIGVYVAFWLGVIELVLVAVDWAHR